MATGKNDSGKSNNGEEVKVTRATDENSGVLEVRLERPPANAIDQATSKKLGEAFRTLRDDESLRVGIVSSADAKFFSAGWDLKAAAAGEEVTNSYGVGGFAGLQELLDMNKPVLCALEGMAVGGGFELALSCDIIYATPESSFALPEIRAGTLADAASIKLPKRIPYHVAIDMLLTGRWMSAQEAVRWGIVKELVAADELMEHVRKQARLLASGPSLVFAAIKEVVREAEGKCFQDVMSRISRQKFRTIEKLYNSEDHQEGFNAFAEKRPPRWKGR